MPTALKLFERHHRAVFRFLRRLEGSSEDAEDLTQEVFLRTLKALDGYEERQLERAWVFRIARNVWLDHRRSRGRSRATEPLEDGPAAVSPSVGTQIALDQALERLGDVERQAFLLREVAGLSYDEIAETLGISQGAVRNRIHRARLTLRADLSAGVNRMEA